MFIKEELNPSEIVILLDQDSSHFIEDIILPFASQYDINIKLALINNYFRDSDLRKVHNHLTMNNAALFIMHNDCGNIIGSLNNGWYLFENLK